MTTPSEQLRDALGSRLLTIVAEEDELSPAMVSAMVNFLKQFPPAEQLQDLPTAQRISDTLKDYKANMPFLKTVSLS
tara:strand:+ start:364 stop:594 length:231 start_codon:yes stop_codon:yes gene_type:complete